MRLAPHLILATLTALAAPAVAGAHATVRPLGGDVAAGSFARFVLDAPNEELTTPGTKVVLFIPRSVQARVRARRPAAWKLDVERRTTGTRDAAGRRHYATTRLTWTARPGGAVEPGDTRRFAFRLRAPSRPGSLCFKIDQYYSPSDLGEQPKVDRWRGPRGSSRPASCVRVAAR